MVRLIFEIKLNRSSDLKFIYEFDPNLINWGPLTIRYYGVIFALSLFIGFLFWQWQLKRAKYKQNVIDDIILWGVGGVVVGARLGHCLFYDWHKYKDNLIDILFVWEGGLASHGATIGLIIVLFILAKKNKMHPLEIMDRFSFSAACGAAGVRLGNFFNSEIVGRATDQSWGVLFKSNPQHNILYRHPTQIYEFLMGIFILFMLIFADRISGREKRPLGLLTGLFLGVYFLGRFTVEFFKEFQAKAVIESHSTLTMGQYLSIIPALVGVGIIIWSLKVGKKRTAELNELHLQRIAAEELAETQAKQDAEQADQPAKKKSKYKRRNRK